MNRSTSLFQFACLIISMFLLSCNPKKSDQTNLEPATNYVVGSSDGFIDRIDPVIIKFNNAMVDEDEVGKALSKNPFQFEPSIKGNSQWIASDALQFLPDENWDWGTVYQGQLDLSKLLQKEVQDFKFSIITQKKDFKIIWQGLSAMPGKKEKA